MSGDVFAELSPPYSTIVADPPWRYDEGFATAPGGRKPTTAPLPYSSMTVAEICALPVQPLAARDCWLFLWTTNAYLFDARIVAESWGFTYRQMLVWHKTGNPSPFGGSVAPNHAEFLLVAAKGSPAVVERMKGSVLAANKRSGGGGHSQKPPAVLDAIERTAAGPYLELFSRSPRLGWDSWGKGYEIGAAAESGAVRFTVLAAITALACLAAAAATGVGWLIAAAVATGAPLIHITHRMENQT